MPDKDSLTLRNSTIVAEPARAMLHSVVKPAPLRADWVATDHCTRFIAAFVEMNSALKSPAYPVCFRLAQRQNSSRRLPYSRHGILEICREATLRRTRYKYVVRGERLAIAIATQQSGAAFPGE